ncbi:MAG: aspartate carbamoyltransferase regulatory subunit [Tissierellia bacterium]|jgi:aspartate carbamoyltransferase regulatory subunit|nr:aspartate carbamoyltransferase regulatory subunit [Tissierellia bacterium]MDD3225932.1 aspartate carbamoyltransferase regulatory subunit [Tissierellia bacterium]MDD3750870.1 aspartate carbamoyltransferase regulatory subunit [Tissierellia bacterium]MDD4045859.1 aspartate carbamoyltransferase regulatory subunit [Tissierellia bacterium]MDD4678023.1 aspartate carbamoyltransferase regulatory subunit [Tissierellia bacterium]
MLNIDSVEKGLVIDHIKAGKAMEIYRYLNLDKMDCSVAIIKNAKSKKFGKKDIIKVENNIDMDLKVLGFIDPNITINVIDNFVIIDKINLELPQEVENVVKCKNPRCITSIEQEIVHKFRLTDKENKIYRCVYCDTAYEGK